MCVTAALLSTDRPDTTAKSLSSEHLFSPLWPLSALWGQNLLKVVRLRSIVCVFVHI